MPQERLVRRDRAAADRHVPVLVAGRELDLEQSEVDDPVDEVALVRDVVVERHRLHAELARELAHRERLDAAYADIRAVIDAINEGNVFRYLTKPWDAGELAAVVRQAKRRLEDAFSGERSFSGRHLDNLTLYV